MNAWIMSSFWSNEFTKTILPITADISPQQQPTFQARFQEILDVGSFSQRP